MKLSIAYSPCPNDTFIFDAMVHHKIDTEGIEFDVTLADVEALNQKAFANTFDITKLSFHAFGWLAKDYALLNSGSALGFGCGPLLISKKNIAAEELATITVAIPGKYTTANFLLGFAFPEIQNKREMIFSDIEHAVLDGTVDAGVIIHENRFTYDKKGLIKIADLGEVWEQKTAALIPLGGIVIKRNLEKTIQKKVERVMQRSVAFALANPKESSEYVKMHAQELDEAVTKNHINLYVNEFTANLGSKGKDAIDVFFKEGISKRIFPEISLNLFVS
jgi:1,4-dihydroxy-6-naphthoate synthase